MATRNITLLVRVQGAAQSARALADTTASLHRMGQESRRTSDLVRNMSSSFSRLGNVVSHAARYSAFAVTALAAATVKAGISFNATMEASKTAFTTILGSKKAADDYVKSLVRIATETPSARSRRRGSCTPRTSTSSSRPTCSRCPSWPRGWASRPRSSARR
jgi:hypothetical protein